MSIISVVVKGGPVMIPIILGSILGLAIVCERFLLLRQTLKVNTGEFIEKVFRFIRTNRMDHAQEFCDKNSGYPLAAVFKAGLEKWSLPAPRLEKILEQTGNNQIQKLEKFLGLLISIINIEPLLGFLGTITGLIRAFMSWEEAGANVTVDVLAAGIYEAMITTAAGLIVAIPLYLCYHYFVSQIKYIANDLNNYSLELLEVLSESEEGKRT